MTDNEIIKALEYCSVKRKCGECSYRDRIGGCITPLMRDALDLINRERKIAAEERSLKNLYIMRYEAVLTDFKSHLLERLFPRDGEGEP